MVKYLFFGGLFLTVLGCSNGHEEFNEEEYIWKANISSEIGTYEINDSGIYILTPNHVFDAYEFNFDGEHYEDRFDESSNVATIEIQNVKLIDSLFINLSPKYYLLYDKYRSHRDIKCVFHNGAIIAYEQMVKSDFMCINIDKRKVEKLNESQKKSSQRNFYLTRSLKKILTTTR